jgi:hypothetical protein
MYQPLGKPTGLVLLTKILDVSSTFETVVSQKLTINEAIYVKKQRQWNEYIQYLFLT